MTCNHASPAGYAYCGTCGAQLERARCRCGFVAAPGDVFCGRCGTSLAEVAVAAAAAAEHRFDLEQLAQQAAQEKQFIESTHKVRVAQDDIRKLLTRRRKRFG